MIKFINPSSKPFEKELTFTIKNDNKRLHLKYLSDVLRLEKQLSDLLKIEVIPISYTCSNQTKIALKNIEFEKAVELLNSNAEEIEQILNQYPMYEIYRVNDDFDCKSLLQEHVEAYDMRYNEIDYNTFFGVKNTITMKGDIDNKTKSFLILKYGLMKY